MINEVLPLLEVALNAFIVYFILLVLMKLVGKHEISQLTFFDFIVAITIGSIAASVTVDHELPLSHALTSMIIWAGLTFLLDFISQKSLRARKLLQGEPTIVVQNGKILEKNMAKMRYNLNDLLMQLRSKSVFNLSEVEFAIAEPNGELSVLLKSQDRPLTPKDCGLGTGYEGLPAELIVDGDIIEENLKEVGLSKEWLYGELRRRGIADESHVTFASLETDGTLYVATRQDDPEHLQKVED